MRYSAKAALATAPHGERPGIEVRGLRDTGSRGWTVVGVVQKVDAQWVTFDADKLDAALSSMGWERTQPWDEHGSCSYAPVVRKRRNAPPPG